MRHHASAVPLREIPPEEVIILEDIPPQREGSRGPSNEVVWEHTVYSDEIAGNSGDG